MARYLEKPLFSTPYKDLLRKKGGNHLFLRQLQQLGIPDAHCDDAVSHYWGFYAERARLQAEGNVLPSVWDARNEVLHQRWKIITGNAKIEVDRDVSEDTLAKKIFVKTIDGNYTAKLGLHETSHPYFTSGNYHDLANVPEHTCFVYWHSLFAPEKEDGTK